MARQKYRQFFELIGNSSGGPKVIKSNSNFGDGEIGTGKGGYLTAKITAKLELVENNKKVKLTVNYFVTEDGFGSSKSKNDDKLQMSKVFYFDVSSFTELSFASRIEGNKRVTTKVKDVRLLTSTGEQVIIADYSAKIDTKKEQHKELVPTWTGTMRPWLPASELRIKVDGKGKELDKEGNLAIKGYVYFDIERVDEVTTEVIYVEEENRPRLDWGVGEKLAELPAVMKSALGRGYDIAGTSPEVSSCKYPVLDLERLNHYKHIVVSNDYDSDNTECSGESLSEFTEDITKTYGFSISANLLGATFAHETKASFSESKSNKEICKYKRLDFKSIYHTYQIDEFRRPEKLLFFLTEKFKQHLNEMNPQEFIETYGTHVVLGMKSGGRLTYNMRYRESIVNSSNAKTIETSTTIGYDSKGAPKTSGNDNVANKLNELYEQLGKTSTPEELTKLTQAISGLQGIQTKTTTEPAQSGTWGGSIGVTSNETEKKTFKDEDKTMDVTCSSVGGDPAMTGAFMLDNTKYDKWSATVEARQVFMDFVPGAIIPIQEFIPKSRRGENYKLTKELVAEAAESYLQGKVLQIGESEIREGTIDFNTCGSRTDVKQQDDEVDSQKGKDTGWEVYLQLVNFADGFAGCTIALTIHEGGMGKNKTILQNTQEVKISKGCFSTLAIANKNTSFHVQGTLTGEQHNWIDVTEKFKECEFLDTYNSNVYVKVDGKGGDENNIGVKGCLKIKYRAC